MVLMNDIDSIATSGGVFGFDLKIWTQSTGIYDSSIEYAEGNEQRFVQAMAYVPFHKLLVVGYHDDMMVVFKMDKGHNSNILYKKRLSASVGSDETIKTILYIETKEHILSLEQNATLNFLRIAKLLSGEQVKSCVVSNRMITCLYSYESLDGEIMLVLAFDKDIAFKSYENLEDNLQEFCPEFFLYGHEADVLSVCYDKETNSLISTGMDLYIIVWDMESHVAKLAIDQGHNDFINRVIMLDNNVFASASKDRTIIVWSLSDGELLQTYSYHSSNIYNIEYNPETKELISCSYDKNLRAVKFAEDYKTYTNLRIINGHTSTVKLAQIDFINHSLITIGIDKTIKIWDYANLRLIKSIDTKDFYDNFIILNDDLHTLIKVDLSKKIKLMSLKSEEFYNTIEETNSARTILNLYDGISFLVGLSNSEISFYNYVFEGSDVLFKKKRTLYHCPGEDALDSSTKVGNLKISKLINLNLDKRLIASGANDGSICIIHSENFHKTYIPQKVNSEVIDIISVRITEEEFIIAYALANGKFFIYDLKNKIYQKHLVIDNVSSIDRLNDNYLIISYSATNVLEIYDSIEHKIIRKIDVSYNYVKPIYYLKDGYRLIAINGTSSTNFCIDLIEFMK